MVIVVTMEMYVYRLTLLYNTVLFLSREPIRKACLSRLSGGRNWTHVFNLSWTRYMVYCILYKSDVHYLVCQLVLFVPSFSLYSGSPLLL